MKRIGNISPKIETPKNFEAAFWDYSKGKKRKEIDLFWKDLEVNLQKLLEAYRSETWRTSPYQMKIVYEPKVRPVHKLPVADHVMQHAVMRLVEPYLRRSLYWKSPAGTKGKGTHFFHELIKRDIYDSPQTETLEGHKKPTTLKMPQETRKKFFLFSCIFKLFIAVLISELNLFLNSDRFNSSFSRVLLFFIIIRCFMFEC